MHGRNKKLNGYVIQRSPADNSHTFEGSFLKLITAHHYFGQCNEMATYLFRLAIFINMKSAKLLFRNYKAICT
jgi:hypothetical protein